MKEHHPGRFHKSDLHFDQILALLTNIIWLKFRVQRLYLHNLSWYIYETSHSCLGWLNNTIQPDSVNETLELHCLHMADDNWHLQQAKG